MCRFALYLGEPITIGSLVTEPNHSIIRQSTHSEEREEPLNGDGFGVAWYASDDPIPAQFREISPAWSNLNLLALSRVTRSSAILVHIRAATMGAVQQPNCHPFAHARYTFMHNGDVGGFRALRRALRAELTDESYEMVRGSTDSEHVFALFLDRLSELRAAEPDAAELDLMARALEAAIADTERLRAAAGVTQRSRLNLVVCNGAEAVVVRWSSPGEGHNSLYVRSGKAYRCEGGVCRMLPPAERDNAVIVASEPLSDDGEWTAVPADHLLTIDAERVVAQRPIASP